MHRMTSPIIRPDRERIIGEACLLLRHAFCFRKSLQIRRRTRTSGPIPVPVLPPPGGELPWSESPRGGLPERTFRSGSDGGLTRNQPVGDPIRAEARPRTKLDASIARRERCSVRIVGVRPADPRVSSPSTAGATPAPGSPVSGASNGPRRDSDGTMTISSPVARRSST